jgi:hypothetical protein
MLLSHFSFDDVISGDVILSSLCRACGVHPLLSAYADLHVYPQRMCFAAPSKCSTGRYDNGAVSQTSTVRETLLVPGVSVLLLLTRRAAPLRSASTGAASHARSRAGRIVRTMMLLLRVSVLALFWAATCHAWLWPTIHATNFTANAGLFENAYVSRSASIAGGMLLLTKDASAVGLYVWRVLDDTPAYSFALKFQCVHFMPLYRPVL